jgi:hypothetical protein
VGFAPETNLQERKSANINALSQPFTMQDIASTVGGASAPTFEYTVTGGTIPGIEIYYEIGSGQVSNGVSGQNTIQTYYAPIIVGIGQCTASSLTFSTETLSRLNWDFESGPEDAPVIPIVNFPNLTKLISTISGGGSINIRYVPEITTLSVPLLTNGYIDFYSCESLTTLNISSLTNSGGGINVYSCSSLSFSGISFNTQFSRFYFDNCIGLGTTINIPATEIKTSFNNCSGITTLSFPNAVTYGYTIYFNNCSSLENLTLGSIGTLKSIYYDPNDGAYVNLNGCALSSASVTHVLDILISLDGTNGTTEWGDGSTLDISGGTNAIPSAGDLVKIGILEARGATVLYNS